MRTDLLGGRARLTLVLALPLFCTACGRSAPPAPQAVGARAQRMAERLPEVKGVENMGRVAAGIYRGAAPTMEGLASLRAMGIKTVINLRHYHGSREQRACRGLGLDYVAIGLPSSDRPRDEDVRQFLRIVTDPAHQPVFFHCWRGKDRTGMMCAIYRMTVEDWSLAEAQAEMDAFGFFSGWKDLRAYVEAFPARRDAVWPRKPKILEQQKTP